MRETNSPRRLELKQQLKNLGQSLSMYRYGKQAIQLVWQTDWRLTILLALLTVVAGLLPAAIAYIGKLIVDTVVQAAQSGIRTDRMATLTYLGIEAILVAILAATQQGLNLCQSLLRALLGHKVMC
jgi:hypothetical protein